MRSKRPADEQGRDERDCVERIHFSMQPLSPEECRRHEDAQWASHDPEVMSLYEGQFVVPYDRKIVAHGTDAARVLADAARITGRQADELPLIGVVDPLLDIPHH
jgi:hypothetical protein